MNEPVGDQNLYVSLNRYLLGEEEMSEEEQDYRDREDERKIDEAMEADL